METIDMQFLAKLAPRTIEAGRGERLNVAGIDVRVLLSAADTGGMYSLFETNDPQGFGPPLHTHTRETELLLVLEGRYRLRMGDSEREFGPGEGTFAPAGVPHLYLAIGPGPNRLLNLTSPGGYELFFREVDKAGREGRLSPETLGRIAGAFGLRIDGPPATL